MYDEDYSVDSNSIALSWLKQRRYRNRKEELWIQNKNLVGGTNADMWKYSKCMNTDDHSIDSHLFLPLTLLKVKLQRTGNCSLSAI